MWIILKWHIPPYVKGVIIYNTLNKSRENSKKGNRKNESENDHTFSLHFFRIFSQRILAAVPKRLKM